MKPTLKSIARTLRWRNKPRWLKTSFRRNFAVERVTKLTVLQGPFKGMKYPSADPTCTFMPKLLGTYEMELYAVIERLISNQYRTVVNVGASEGYYAVGLAMRMPQASIIAYESDTYVAKRLVEITQMNGVRSQIDIRGHCDSRELECALSAPGKSLVIMDIDGGEMPLLDPAGSPHLAGATILVELHPHLIPDIELVILERFETTHTIYPIAMTKRQRSDIESIGVASYFLKNAMKEHRPSSQSWYLMEPICHP